MDIIVMFNITIFNATLASRHYGIGVLRAWVWYSSIFIEITKFIIRNFIIFNILM